MSQGDDHTARGAGAREAYHFDHVAIGLPRVADASDFVAGELGGRPYEGGPGIGFRGGQWRFAGGGVLELLEPDGPPGGFLERFLARRGPGVHHVTFKVPHFRSALARAQRCGFDVVSVDDSNPGWKEAFLHPKQAQGIVVQLAESHPDLDDFWGPDWEHFPAPPAILPPAATLAGLRLRVHDGERARVLWEELLGGRSTPADGACRYRWPDSPMQIAVEIDARGPEGAVAIELDAPRPLRLPDGPHPVLGARFVQRPDA